MPSIIDVLLLVGLTWLAWTLREIPHALERNAQVMEQVLESLAEFAQVQRGWTQAVNKEFPVLWETVRGVAPRMDTFELRLTALEKQLVQGETGNLSARDGVGK